MRLEGRRVLITGGSGALGSELIPLLTDEGAEVVAPTHKELPVEDVIACVEAAKEPYDLVIHAAAWTNVPGAELLKNRAKVIDVNIFGTANMAYAFMKKSKMVYISTDYVYAGHEGNYTVKSHPSPFCFYGFSKLAGEAYLAKTDLVLRTSFVKRETWGEDKKQLTQAFRDVYTSKDWVDIIAKKIVEAICKNKKGILNIGTKRKAVIDLAREEFPEVKSVPYKDINLPYDYPVDCSMKSSI
jgi:dTDP-4-dehydrorhamnose reductase